jgi:phosphoglycerol transferase
VTPAAHKARRALFEYAATALLSSFAAFVLMKLWRADLRVPFDYGGDATIFQYVIKTAHEHGWYLYNPNAGAPWGLDLRDYPFAAHDTLHVVLLEILSLFTRDWGLTTNLYFLLGFPLISCASLAVLRHTRVAPVPAIAASVLYSFLPSRLIKGEGHLFLDVFFQVPLAVLVLLWLAGDDPPFTAERPGRRWPALSLTGRRSLATLGICTVVATTSLYYAYFALCLAFAVGVWASLEHRSARHVLSATIVVGVIAVLLAVQALPTLFMHVQHGPNPGIATRNSGEAEIFGLKIVQLLLPADGHRSAWIRALKHRYYSFAPLSNENDCTSLGCIGDVGFLFLLGVVVRTWRPVRERADLTRPLAVMNLMAILLGTIGGFSSLIALLITPQFRTYSRLNVYIGFFALFAVALLLERIITWRQRVGMWVAGAALVLGLVDQSSLDMIRKYAATETRFGEDASFVKRIEATLPAGSMVYELPYIAFPDFGLVQQLYLFDAMILPLHSTSLRWSQPVMHGRQGDAFEQKMDRVDPARIGQRLARVGYSGVVVLRAGYADRGAAVEAGLRAALAAEPVVDGAGRFAFFDLSGLRAKDARLPSPEQLGAMLNPVDVLFPSGCFGAEHADAMLFHWCEGSGEWVFENDGTAPRRARVRATLVAGRPPARLTFEGSVLAASVDLEEPVAFEREILVPPGRSVVKFHCDGKPVHAAPDPRTLVWRAENLTVDEGDDGPPDAPDAAPN